MVCVYAIECRRPDIGILENCLGENYQVQAIELDNLEKATPPELLFVGWNGEQDDNPVRSRLRRMETLTRTREIFAFKDIPIFLVSDGNHRDEIGTAIRKQVYDVLFTPLTDEGVRKAVQKAMRPVGKETTLDVRLVNPFVQSAIEVLSTMANTNIVRKEVLLKKDYRMFGDVSAVIGIMGEKIEGSVAVTFHEELAHRIVGRMLGMDGDALSSEEVHDGLGELVNMISGKAKTSLSTVDGLQFNLALPTIVTGIGHEIAHRPGTPCLVIVFDAEDMPFAVQVAISS